MSGTVTFLFTDIEGSTQLWEQEPEKMQPALARHDALLRASIVSNSGTVVKMTGDGVYAAFDDPVCALGAALAIQCGLVDADMTNGLELRVRCGLHLGAVERRDDDYFGSPVNRAARIMGAAHGGQILLSAAVVEQVRKQLPPSSSLRDLGRVRLKDLAIPEHVYQLVHPQLQQDFPALRSLETTPNNLPQQISSFVGRGRETAEVKRLLAQSRLLTLVGVGGIGKTRLALQVAADTHDAYPDGVWFVELGSITDPLLVPSSVAQVLGRSGTGRCRPYAHARQSSQVPALAAAARQLRAPDRRLRGPRRRAADGGTGDPRPCQQSGAASSCRRANLSRCRRCRCPLPMPSLESLAHSEAAQMFIERIRLQEPGFVLTERQVAATTSICNSPGRHPAGTGTRCRARSLVVDRRDQRPPQGPFQAAHGRKPLGTSAPASPAGTIAYFAATNSSRLNWFDRSGRNLGEVGVPGDYLSLSISPDGRSVLADRTQPELGTYDLWRLDLERGVETRLTSDPDADFGGVWLPDGQSIVYSTIKTRNPILMRRDLGSGSEEPLLPGEAFQSANDISSDGRLLAFLERASTGKFHALTMPLEGDRRATDLLPDDAQESNVRFSPDGRYVAYISDLSGEDEAYVAPLARPGASVRISRAGAVVLRWSRDGREIVFLDPKRAVVSVPVRLGAEIELGTPVTLFELPQGVRWLNFDVSPDGKRLLAIVRERSAGSQPAIAILGWDPEARR